MYNPVSTYRIQFHKDFTFDDFERQLDYVIGLGVKTIYASPIFTAVPGSTHGYDALDPHSINPEIGTPDQLRRITSKLQQAGVGWIQDIVPNHMAYDTRNPWLYDVLEKGQHSAFADFFDVTWSDTASSGHIMAPFLGKTLEEAVRDGEINLLLHEGRLHLAYFDSKYPLRLRSYESVLNSPDSSDAIRQWISQADEIQGSAGTSSYASAFNELMMQLAGLVHDEKESSYILGRIAGLNTDKESLLQLANDQVYRLCHWQETDGKINYRRFFTVNGLICLNMQNEAVFNTFHSFIKQLVDDNIFQGVRVDHVDGLYDPAAYLERLRNLLGHDCYIVVEKILELNEELHDSWPIDGTTGYDFLAQVNQLLTYAPAEESFSRYYYSIVPEHRTIQQQMRDKKSLILYKHMGGELENLYQLLMQLVHPEQYAQMRTEDLKTAIAEFLVHMPVYRFYGNSLPPGKKEAKAVQEVLEQATVSRPDLSPAFSLLKHLFCSDEKEASHATQVQHFYKRLMQLSGPLMAKGVEDTLMYTNHRFIGHNEVGDAQAQFGWNADRFHEAMRKRASEWPLALNATSTHDTKRGEDVRARLQALSAMPVEWLEAAKGVLSGYTNDMPDLNDAYALLQAIIGSYPEDEEEKTGFAVRLEAFVEKALRESKRRSDWAQPDINYEETAKKLARKWCDPSGAFWKEFSRLYKSVQEFGRVQSMVQLLLKFTCPGTPDIYQGCEGWDFSLVDPDNRRPVNYGLRDNWLQEMKDNPLSPGEWWFNFRDGRLKFALSYKLLALRKMHQELWSRGAYIPLKTAGALNNHVFAFARQLGEEAIIVAVPLYAAALASSYHSIDWQDTTIELPDSFEPHCENLIGSKTADGQKIAVGQFFSEFPGLLLRTKTRRTTTRGAGLLLHISSLPGNFGTGDLGPEAYRFADFLAAARQQYWQLLPINPIEKGQGFSPYSSTSSHAGNRLFISLELLVSDGLLSAEDLHAYHQQQSGASDFEAAQSIRDALFPKARAGFLSLNITGVEDFHSYCAREKNWLDDFASYTVLKQKNDGKPWYEWPAPFKLRAQNELDAFNHSNCDELDAIRWEQFIFSRQWQLLKSYCHDRGIKLIGDLPFYVSYDSVDVWAHRDLFDLDESGNRRGIAGVPPDAFSDDGQLWGMPVYRWDRHKQTDYTWWANRLARNQQLFDLVRLDHFRAFAAYWEVPADAETAREGKWVTGPGADFFKSMSSQLNSLNFIAEDLGDIDDAVLQLRDEFSLPGMKVLQFAFGDDLAGSPHIPHNYERNFIAYTGTHDNNTAVGWFRTEVDSNLIERIASYAGRSISEDELPRYLCRTAMGSVAETAILPVQDLLGLDEGSRMNRPSSPAGNWAWRLLPGQLTKEARRLLREWTECYNRTG
jgi:malto-oligosyltrehalose synthase/4-alpha-glucanotransferase